MLRRDRRTSYYQADGLWFRQLAEQRRNGAGSAKLISYASFGTVIRQLPARLLNSFVTPGASGTRKTRHLLYAPDIRPAIGRFLSEDPIGSRGGMSIPTWCQTRSMPLTLPG